MSHENNDNSHDDELLNRAIRMTRAEKTGEFYRPSDAAIQSYLLGNADEEDIAVIRAALIQSSSFRTEIIGMAEDMALLSGPEVRRAFDEVKVPDAPRPGEMRTQSTEVVGLSRILYSIRDFFQSPIGLAGLATASIIALVSITVLRQGNESLPGFARADWTQDSVMETGLFVSNITREPHDFTLPVTLYESHQLAAEAEFQRIVEYADGRYALRSDYLAPDGSSDAEGRVYVELVDSQGKRLESYTTNLPNDSRDYAIWVLTIPDRKLLTFELVADSVRAVWPGEKVPTGCITVTYRIDGQFAAATGKNIGL